MLPGLQRKRGCKRLGRTAFHRTIGDIEARNGLCSYGLFPFCQGQALIRHRVALRPVHIQSNHIGSLRRNNDIKSPV